MKNPDISNMTDEQCLTAIACIENDLKFYDKLKNKPQNYGAWRSDRLGHIQELINRFDELWQVAKLK